MEDVIVLLGLIITMFLGGTNIGLPMFQLSSQLVEDRIGRRCVLT